MKKTSMKLLCLISLCNVDAGIMPSKLCDNDDVPSLVSKLDTARRHLTGTNFDDYRCNIEKKLGDALLRELRRKTLSIFKALDIARGAGITAVKEELEQKLLEDKAKATREKEMQSMKQKLEQLTSKLEAAETERDALMQALEAVGIEKNRNNLAIQEQLNRLTGKEDELKALQVRFHESQEESKTLQTERNAFMKALEAVGVNNLELERAQSEREEKMRNSISAMQEQLNLLTSKDRDLKALQSQNEDLQKQLQTTENKCDTLMQALRAIKSTKSSRKSPSDKSASSVNSSIPPIAEIVIPTPPQDLSPAARSVDSETHPVAPSEVGSSVAFTWDMVPSLENTIQN